jgi:hypothetical protein
MSLDVCWLLHVRRFLRQISWKKVNVVKTHRFLLWSAGMTKYGQAASICIEGQQYIMRNT